MWILDTQKIANEQNFTLHCPNLQFSVKYKTEANFSLCDFTGLRLTHQKYCDARSCWCRDIAHRSIVSTFWLEFCIGLSNVCSAPVSLIRFKLSWSSIRNSSMRHQPWRYIYTFKTKRQNVCQHFCMAARSRLAINRRATEATPTFRNTKTWIRTKRQSRVLGSRFPSKSGTTLQIKVKHWQQHIHKPFVKRSLEMILIWNWKISIKNFLLVVNRCNLIQCFVLAATLRREPILQTLHRSLPLSNGQKISPLP